MEWERHGRGWRLQDAEDDYEIIPCKLHKVACFTVWKNGAIWLATTDTFSAGDQAVVGEIRNPMFYSLRPEYRSRNVERQARRNAEKTELKRLENNDRAKRLKTVKLYRW